MTDLSVKYWDYLENVRANQAREQENYRSNLAKEAETQRANLAYEAENYRAHVASEQLRGDEIALGYQQLAETQRSNAAREAETYRSNVASQSEQNRHNAQNELLAAAQQELDIIRTRNDVNQAQYNNVMKGIDTATSAFQRIGSAASNATNAVSNIISAARTVIGIIS